MAARLYLDYNATAPLLPAAREALVSALGAANPSSVHREGRKGRLVVEEARRDIAALIGSAAEAVVFTSGASEAAATVLSTEWVVDRVPTRIDGVAVLDTDHACVREGGAFAAGDMTRVPVDAQGVVDLPALDEWASGFDGRRTGLLVLCHANSETGVLQPIERICERMAARQVLVALDVAQSAGRIALERSFDAVDALFLSGHKIGAAKGVGALALRSEGTRPMPLIRGGGQEGGRRAGTLPVELIASFGAAARVTRERLSQGGRAELEKRRIYVEGRLASMVPDAYMLGRDAERLPNTVAVCVPGVSAETAQMALDLDGIAVSAGSACSSGKTGRSHVIEAMNAGGLHVDADDGAIRVSFGYETTVEELDRFVDSFAGTSARLRGTDRQTRAA